MAWLRLGDTSATFPALLDVCEAPGADGRSVNEVFGFFMRCAAQSAQHPHATDYIITMSTAVLIAGTKPEADRLISMASFTGLMTVIEMGEGRRAVQLLNDPEFVHIKTADILAFEKQRRLDNGNPSITAVVRHRDGDACRYCGIVVNFAARTGQLAGTYDHRPPGVAAIAETAVVACSSCNGRRGDKPLEVADAMLPLLAVPTHPYYSRSTRSWLQGYAPLLAERGLTPPPTLEESVKDLKPGTPLQQRPEPAPDGVRPGAARPAEPAPDGVRPALVPTQASPEVRKVRKRQDAGVPATGTPGRDGSGRVGSVRDGSARSADPAPPPPHQRQRRGRRGRRNHTSTVRGEA